MNYPLNDMDLTRRDLIAADFAMYVLEKHRKATRDTLHIAELAYKMADLVILLDNEKSERESDNSFTETR